MKKTIIHQFDPVIYPSRIWVGINPSFEDVESKFWGLTDQMERIPITKDQHEVDCFTIARTHAVTSKEDGWVGLFVSIHKLKRLDTKTICHESAHCADFICENFGIQTGSFDGGEAYAYLIGWIAECIEKVKLNKL